MNSFAQDIIAASVIALVAMNIPQHVREPEVVVPEVVVVKSPKEHAKEMRQAAKEQSLAMKKAVKERTKEMMAAIKQRTKEMEKEAYAQAKMLRTIANAHAKTIQTSTQTIKTGSPTTSPTTSQTKKAFVADWARLPGNEQVVYIRHAKKGLTANGVHLGQGRICGQDGVMHETLSKFAHWERNKMEAAGLLPEASDRTINAWERVRFLSPDGVWTQFDTLRTLV